MNKIVALCLTVLSGIFLSNHTIAQDISRPASDSIINSSINAFVAPGSFSTLGFIVVPSCSFCDIDVLIIAEGEDNFDAVLEVRLDTTGSAIIASNDDFARSSTNFPDNFAALRVRECILDEWGFGNRLNEQDSLVVVSIPLESGNSRTIFAEVREFNGESGRVNLQLLQIDGAVSGCPDF